MAIDPNILFQLGKGVTPLMSPADIQEQQMQREVGGLKLNALRQSAADDTAQRDIYRTSTPDMIPNKLLQAGLVKPAMEFQKSQSDQRKSQSDALKSEYEQISKKYELAGQIMAPVRDQATWDVARQETARVFGAEAAAQMPPQYDPVLIEQKRAQALSVKQQLEQKWKEMEYTTPDANARLQAQTSQANNAATVGVSRDRLAFDQAQPKGQVVQTENGPMIVDPRSGEARPITAGGVPVQKPGKEIPANVNKSIIENRQNISKIDKAIAEIDARPGALGPLNMIPGAETVRQFTDPEGVIARAGVADIGSLILHDRSGAAVTASETPRLRPFIPSASDRPEEAKKKLQRFKEIYEEEANLLAQTYGKEQGYKESPTLKPSASKTAAGVARPANKAAFDALPSGTLFIDPNGVTRRKP